MVQSLSNTILTVDADSTARATISRALRQEGHDILEAGDSRTGLELAREHRPAVIILDLSLPDMNGFEFCSAVRATPFVDHTPILFLSEQNSAQLAARALDCGADDYLRKPFADRELTARVRALLRRAPQSTAQRSVTLRLDPESHSVWVNHRQISLTPTEFDLLDYLCSDAEEYYTVEKMLQDIWDYPPGGGDPALVRNHIRNLRRKIEEKPKQPTIIMSLHGRGYVINGYIIR